MWLNRHCIDRRPLAEVVAECVEDFTDCVMFVPSFNVHRAIVGNIVPDTEVRLHSCLSHVISWFVRGPHRVAIIIIPMAWRNVKRDCRNRGRLEWRLETGRVADPPKRREELRREGLPHGAYGLRMSLHYHTLFVALLVARNFSGNLLAILLAQVYYSVTIYGVM